MRRALTGFSVALVLGLSAGCSNGQSAGDQGSGDQTGSRAVAGIGEIQRLFDELPQKGDLAASSPGAFCVANRAAARAGDFTRFKSLVTRIESDLPDDMPRSPRMGFGLLLHALVPAGDHAQFQAGVGTLTPRQQRLVEGYKRYSNRTCARLAPDAAALA